MLNNLLNDPHLVEITLRPVPLTKASGRWSKIRSPRRFELRAEGEDKSPRVVATFETRDAKQRVTARTKWLGRIGKELDLGERDAGRIVNLASFEIVDQRLSSLGPDLIALAINLLPPLLMPSDPGFLWMFDWLKGKGDIPEHVLGDDWIRLDASGSQCSSPEQASYAYFPLIKEPEEKFQVRTGKCGTGRPVQRFDHEFTSGLTAETLAGLVSVFGQYADPRREDRTVFSAATLLAIISLARRAGSKSVRGHQAWAGLLSEAQRFALGIPGKQKSGSTQNFTLSDDTIRRFIEAIRRPRQEWLEKGDFQTKFGYQISNEGDIRPVVSERAVRGDFNTWLQEHVDSDEMFSEPLWPLKEDKRTDGPKTPGIIRWSHVSEKYSQMVRPPVQRDPFIKDSDVWALSDHLFRTFKERDPRPQYLRECPLRSVLFILGLGRCYVGPDGGEIWLWSHRFDNLLLMSMGLKESADGQLPIPGPSYLTAVSKFFKRENFERLDRAVADWFRKENKVSVLEADGGKLRKVKERTWRKPAA